jgi:hypothetical protein
MRACSNDPNVLRVIRFLHRGGGRTSARSTVDRRGNTRVRVVALRAAEEPSSERLEQGQQHWPMLRAAFVDQKRVARACLELYTVNRSELMQPTMDIGAWSRRFTPAVGRVVVLAAAVFARKTTIGTVIALRFRHMVLIEMWQSDDRRCVLILGTGKGGYLLRLLAGPQVVRDESMPAVDDVVATARRWREEEEAARAVL